jgi:Mrp family chromosome partitioning ATPase
MVADENSDRFILQVDAELLIPPETNRFSSSETKRSSLETKPSLPEPSQPEPSQPEPPLSELLQPEPLLSELSQSESSLSELSQAELSLSELSQPESSLSERSQPESSLSERSQQESSLSEWSQAELSLSELLQQESSLSERSQPESSLSESLPFEPSLPETSLPETLQPEPLLPESSTLELPEHKSATLPFPLRESLPVEANPANHSGNDNGTWQLIWQSHWPEHLKSLELAASDQICFLADHLEIQKEQKHKIFSFNSVQSGDGCTTLALCASRELAERGYRVLLVDAHRQHPELPQLLHLKINPEFCEIITLIPDRLELLPWSETSIEINHTTQSFAEIVGSFRDDYDFILLDNGSLVEYPLSEHVLLWREMSSDGVILVLNTKNPAPVSVRTIAQRLLQNQINLLGIVENYV